ncbi:hypothetical protein VZT92_012525 [Zoarces viviparus]|uniref:Uncharacterized protein n=1 Tax=Zoarces viviparus TaxID=48416 RepID=A0AAW1F1E4_ZOAVI
MLALTSQHCPAPSLNQHPTTQTSLWLVDPRGPAAPGPQLRSQGSCQPPATSTPAVRMIAFVKPPLRVSPAQV